VYGQIGLEDTPDEFVERLVAVFREVRRVLAPHGTCWVNMGDSYFGTGRGPSDIGRGQGFHANLTSANGFPTKGLYTHDTLKSKDLLLIPARLALALQADGWWVRSEVIWAKPNPMPESVRDRPTSAHEKVYLLTRAPRYYWDAEAVREEGAGRLDVWPGSRGRLSEGAFARGTRDAPGRNVRNVWTIATEPTPEAHFATFPRELVRRCLAAGCPERVCRTCGRPSERIVERQAMVVRESPGSAGLKAAAGGSTSSRNAVTGKMVSPPRSTTVGWSDCGHDDWRPGVVLDPFIGSGTTARVARALGLHAIGIDLNPDYLAIAARRLGQLSLLAEAS
jgi:DNA modification methylase